MFRVVVTDSRRCGAQRPKQAVVHALPEDDIAFGVGHGRAMPGGEDLSPGK